MYGIGGGLENNAELAMGLFGIAARLGDLDAQLKLAKIYGYDTNQHYDTKTSFKFYQMAADQGSPYAKYKLAILYLDGEGTNQDFIQAYRLFKECSNLGYRNATNIFNIPIDYSKSSDIDYRNISTMFMTICDNKIDSLEYNFGRLYSQNFRFHCGNISTLITADPPSKKAWYERAAKKGNPMALYELGTFYENIKEKSETQDHSNATDYFQRAYENSSIDATYKLATIYLHGHGVSQDLKKVFTLLNEAADMGHKKAHQILNNFNYDDGEDKHEAIKKMLEISAESGQVLSQYKLGVLTSDIKSPYYNTKEAIKWLERASNSGFINAHYQLGLLLELGGPSEKEQQKIISLYRMAGDKRHEQALFRLAQLYHNGATRNYAEAFRLYALAEQQEYQPAQLATCVLSKLAWEEKKSKLPDDLVPGELEYSSCLQMWEVVADQGNVELQYILGKMYEEVGTDSSLYEAAKWYFQAAEHTHTLSIYHLGQLYETGRGVDQDYLQAIKYYKIARDHGNRNALYQLGMVYQHGKGISPNDNKAIYYYTQAVEKGNTMAQFTLGQLFEEGKLLSKNILESVRWYSISNSHGNKKSRACLLVDYDDPYSTYSFYKRLYHILSRIVNINNNSNRRINNELLGEVNYKLGLMYPYAYGAKLDYKEALKCFRESTKLCANDTARFFSKIIYKDILASFAKKYLKRVEMFESVIEQTRQTEQLDLEDIYELGLIYYYGVNSISGDSNMNETRVTIASNRAKSSKYFRMIAGGQLSGKIKQK
jgi:TPR repeat protein